jgi:aminocarboxymuconate-semialdehyde decarboxylase
VPVIDFHAHWTPVRYREAIAERGRWLTLGPDAGELHNSGFRMTLQERLADMDALGVDLQVLSPTDGFYQYENELETTVAVSRACNDEIAEIAAAWPARFLGLGTLPMQDTDAAVAELERAVRSLGLTGVMIGDHVNGATYDDARFTAFWQAAQDLGALVFFHQGLGYRYSFDRYFLQNAIGNHVERATTFAVLAEGGVLDRFGNLKLLFGHGGGYAAWAAARMEKAQGFFRRGHHRWRRDLWLSSGLQIRSRPQRRGKAACRRLPPPVLLRLLHVQRPAAAVPDRQRGRGQGGVRL